MPRRPKVDPDQCSSRLRGSACHKRASMEHDEHHDLITGQKWRSEYEAKPHVDVIKSPSLSLMCKLGSIIVHLEEASGPACSVFDVITTRTILNDPEVQDWLAAMRKAALLPVKRT